MAQLLNLVTSGRISHLRYHDQKETDSFDRKPETYERPFVAQQVTVHDIAGEESKYGLDSHGFQIYKHPSNEKDFVDDEKIKAEYYPETEQLLKNASVTSRACTCRARLT